jgi:hypothetical protein
MGTQLVPKKNSAGLTFSKKANDSFSSRPIIEAVVMTETAAQTLSQLIMHDSPRRLPDFFIDWLVISASAMLLHPGSLTNSNFRVRF